VHVSKTLPGIADDLADVARRVNARRRRNQPGRGLRHILFQNGPGDFQDQLAADGAGEIGE
jgi:hypothetical protein